MKVVTRRTAPESFTHEATIRDHRITVDEPVDQGGEDRGPNPQELLAASLASCVAITIEMYAQRKGWDLEQVEVDCDYEQAQLGSATSFELVLRLPDHLSEEQVERLKVIAGKCPVHRTLEGPVRFRERVEQRPAGS